MNKTVMAKLLGAEPCSGCPNKEGIESLFSNVTEVLSHTQHELWAANGEIALQKKYVEEIGSTLDTALEELEKGLEYRDTLETKLASAPTDEEVAHLRRRLEDAETEIARLWTHLDTARDRVRTARNGVREAEAVLAVPADTDEVEPKGGPRKIRGGPLADEIARYNIGRESPRGRLG